MKIKPASCIFVCLALFRTFTRQKHQIEAPRVDCPRPPVFDPEPFFFSQRWYKNATSVSINMWLCPERWRKHMCIGRKAVAVNNHQHGTVSVWKDWVCTLRPSSTSGMKKNTDLRKNLSPNCRARPFLKSNNLQNWMLLSLNKSLNWETEFQWVWVVGFLSSLVLF